MSGNNLSDVSINTANSKAVMVGSHIKKQYTFKFQGFVQPELLKMTPYKPYTSDLPHNYELYSLDNFKDWNILWKANDGTSKVAMTPATHILNKKIKSTTINRINNILVANTIVVQNK